MGHRLMLLLIKFQRPVNELEKDFGKHLSLTI